MDFTMGNFCKTLATSDQLLAFLFLFHPEMFQLSCSPRQSKCFSIFGRFLEKKNEDIKIYGKIESLKFEAESPPQQHGAL